MATKWIDGKGSCYRAVPESERERARREQSVPRSCPAIESVSEALRDGPKSVRQISGEDGWGRRAQVRVYGVLMRAEAKGIVERVPGTANPILWRLRE